MNDNVPPGTLLYHPEMSLYFLIVRNDELLTYDVIGRRYEHLSPFLFTRRTTETLEGGNVYRLGIWGDCIRVA